MEEFPARGAQPTASFSKEEKIAFVFLIVAGIGGLFFGVKFLAKNLSAPFVISSSGSGYLTSQAKEAAEQEAMKNRDTDADTLSDYDEIYVYKTSAYLADSDSDGENDAMELQSGGDPTCPAGKDCRAADAVPANEGSSIIPASGDASFDFEGAQATLDASTGAGTDLTAAELRELLAQNGADPEVLAQIRDEELMQMYAEALAQISAGGGDSSTP